MKKKYRKKSKQNDMLTSIKRRQIINNIEVYANQEDVRSILERSLSYCNRVSEGGLEYRERDIKHSMVNHIRHMGSSYDDGLKDINNISINRNRRLNYLLYKNATLSRIATLYPFLEKECAQQKNRLYMITDLNNTHRA